MNSGKILEEAFKKSIPDDTYYLRLHDSSVGFDIEHSTQRFALKSPFDVVLYRNGKMYALELKSIQKGGISFSGANPKIKQHQIDELIKASGYGVTAGFVLNFRDGGTYFLPIAQFDFFRRTHQKKSLNENDVKAFGIEISQRKLKVNYRYDLSVLVGGD